MFRFLGVVSKASLGLASVPLEQHKSGNLTFGKKHPRLGKGTKEKKQKKFGLLPTPPSDPPLGLFYKEKKLSN